MNNIGKLIIGSSPIGNILDASKNLENHIINSDIIIVENIDVFNKLCDDLKIKTNAEIHYYGNSWTTDENHEINSITYIINKIKDGNDVLILSDEGTATFQDPGGALVNAAIYENIKITAIPGPNSVITSFVLTGFSSKSFYFGGFLPSKELRISEFNKMKHYEYPMIFLATDDHLYDFIQDAISVFGKNRRAVICMNLTHDSENIFRGTLSEINKNFLSKVYGNYNIIIDGCVVSNDISKFR